MNNEQINPEVNEFENACENPAPLTTPYYRKYYRPTPKSSPRDFIFSMLIFVSSFLCIRWGFFGGLRLGFSVSATILVCVTYAYIRLSGYTLKLFPTICAAGAIACAGVYALYSTPVIMFFLFIGFGVLCCLMVSGSCAHNKFTLGSYGMFLEVLKCVFFLPFNYLSAPFRSFSDLFSKKAQGRKFKQILTGVLLAFPALLIIVPLLMNADYAFKYFLTEIFGDFGILLLQIVFAFAMAVYVFAMVFADIKNLEEFKESDRKLKSKRAFSVISVTSFMSLISVVYLVYLLSQLAYFTSAFRSILPDQFFAAEYARRGFFEMAVITCINLLIVSISLLTVKRGKQQTIPAPVKAVITFIMMFSLVIIGTSLSKMWLYIERFGMTHLRIMTCVFMLMLIAAVIFITVRVYIKNFSYMKSIVTACLLIGITVSYINIDGIIARYNTNAHMNGKHKTADVMLIASLGDAGVPSLVKLLDSKNQYVVQMAAWQLDILAGNRLNFDDKEPSLQKYKFTEYNLTRDKAEKLLLENYERFRDTEQPFYRYGKNGELIFYEYEEDLRRAIDEYGDYNPYGDRYFYDYEDYEDSEDYDEYNSDFSQYNYSEPEYYSTAPSEPKTYSSAKKLPSEKSESDY